MKFNIEFLLYEKSKNLNLINVVDAELTERERYLHSIGIDHNTEIKYCLLRQLKDICIFEITYINKRMKEENKRVERIKNRGKIAREMASNYNQFEGEEI